MSKLLDTEIGSAWFEKEAAFTFSEDFLGNIRKFRSRR